ncbi:transmembrane protein [Anaeramoeba flamelloides]|uniref:Transmembrane protein n=1 Tax=Anaeramoeba flamelloides TaxID=1746091 RepID=A0AAV7YG20_9EUKA|nr:transmembrane protein [Anaeramoeba flamelloides]
MKPLQTDLKVDVLSPQKIAGAFTLLIIIIEIVLTTTGSCNSDFKSVSQVYNLTEVYPAKLQFQIENLNRLNQFLITTIHFQSSLPIGMIVSPTVNVTTYGSDTSNKISQNKKTNLEIRCPANGNCSKIQIDHQRYLKYNRYIFDFEINDDSGYFLFDKLYLEFHMEKPKFSYILIFLKFILQCILISWLFFFIKLYRGIPWSGFIYEQKLILFLLFSLLVINDPLYPLKFISRYNLQSILDQYLSISIFCVVQLFFFCIISSYRMPKESRTFKVFYLPKITFISILWIFLLVDALNQPKIRLHTFALASSKAFFYSYGSIFLISFTWNLGKTRRCLKQKRYIKRFTFFIISITPLLIFTWVKVVMFAFVDKQQTAQQIVITLFIIDLDLILLSYGWFYNNPKELINQYSLNKEGNVNKNKTEQKNLKYNGDLQKKEDELDVEINLNKKFEIDITDRI